MPGPRVRRFTAAPPPMVIAKTWNEALSTAPGWALKVSLCYIAFSLLSIFILNLAGWYGSSDRVDLYSVVSLFSVIIVYPCATVVGLACLRFLPSRMRRRRFRRAALTGLVAALLLWSGLGESMFKEMGELLGAMPFLRQGWIKVLIICTPFAMAVSLAHALALFLPPGRAPGPVLPQRLTR